MREIDPNRIEGYILRLAQEFSAKKNVSLDDHVYEKLRIDREDAVEFYSKIEEKFSIDLRPVTELLFESKEKWFKKPRRRIEARDPSLKEISAFIAENRKS